MGVSFTFCCFIMLAPVRRALQELYEEYVMTRQILEEDII